MYTTYPHPICWRACVLFIIPRDESAYNAAQKPAHSNEAHYGKKSSVKAKAFYLICLRLALFDPSDAHLPDHVQPPTRTNASRAGRAG